MHLEGRRGWWVGGFGAVVAFVVAMAACVGDTSNQQPAVDAGVDATTDVGADAPVIQDAGVDAPPCDLSKPFKAPTLLPVLNSTSNEDGAHLSADETTIYFSATRDGGAGGYDLYYSTRATRMQSFAPPTPLTELNTSSDDVWPLVDATGLTIYFSSSRPNNASVETDVYVATRLQKSGPFGTPSKVTVVNSGTYDVATSLAPSGALYLDTLRDGTYHVYRAASVSGIFQAPVSVASINDDQSTGAVLSPDELTIYWGSARPTPSNVGGRDVFRARRKVISDPFDTPENVTELNTTGTDVPTWLSPDGCRIYLVSDRATGVGGYDLYVAEKP